MERLDSRGDMYGLGRRPALIAFALALVGLGALALVYDDFALVWQPVPSDVPYRSALAYASGLLMLVGGMGLLSRRTEVWSIRLLCPYLFLWLLLKIPALLLVPRMEAVWLNFGEIAVLFAAGLMLIAELSCTSSDARSRKTRRILVASSLLLFGLSLVPIGLSHIFYTGQTVELIPMWFPFRAAVAYLTGAAQVCCGLCVLLAIYPRIAAQIEAAMVALFALFVWGERILGTPSSRLAWTAFFISWFFAASAWVVSQQIPPGFRPTRRWS